jgi:hypothetical protein
VLKLWAAEDRRKDDSSGGSMTKVTRGNDNTAIELPENINVQLQEDSFICQSIGSNTC